MSLTSLSSSGDCLCRGRRHSSSSGTPTTVLCPACVDQALQKHVEQRDKAMRERTEARDTCARRLTQLRSELQQDDVNNTNLEELAYESQHLRDRLASLRQQCGSLAVQVASKVVDNDERRLRHDQEEANNPSLPRQQLHRLHHVMCDPNDGSLAMSIRDATQEVRVLRFQWASHAFVMHRLAVGTDNQHNDDDDHDATTTSAPPSSSRHDRPRPRGIGKIGGLPLPHAGPELYGVLPPQELQSALRLVASLTCTVARCLGIVLPHPILLQPNDSNIATKSNGGDIADTVPALPKESSSMDAATIDGEENPGELTSLKSLMGSTTSAWGRSAKQALARATGALQEDATAMAPPSMEASLVAKRLRHATCVVLAEDSSQKSLYALSHETMLDDSFAIGLQLLQNNVVALCIRAGVPVANLWPAEALLLNLHALWLYCQEQITDTQYLLYNA